jgi:uncharacterized membrane protein
MSAVQNYQVFDPIASPALVVGRKPAGNLVRYALLAMTILACLFSATFATVGVIIERRLDDELTDVQRMAAFLHIFISGLFATICGLGIFSCIAKHRTAASVFTTLIIAQIFFSLGSGILCLCLLFDNNGSMDASAGTAHKELRSISDGFIRMLSENMPLVRGVATAMFVVIWLVEIATIVLGNAYLAQIDEEASMRGEFDPKYDIEDVC